MGVDPRRDVGLVGAAQRRGRARQIGEMEAERGARRDADLAARNMAEQHGAGRLARSDDLDVDAARREPGPAAIVGNDAAAVIVGDLDGLRRRAPAPGQEQGHDQERMSWH